MTGYSDMFRRSAKGEAREADALRTTRRLILAGGTALLILGTGLVFSALDSVRQLDAVAVEAEMLRAQRALFVLTADKTLSAEDVRRLREDYSLADARLVATPEQTDGQLTLHVDDVSAPVYLVWTPRRFGSEMFSSLAPRRIAMSVLLTFIICCVFFWLSRSMRELDRHRRIAHELAIRDGLTGLANRRNFDDTLQRALAAGDRQPLALLCLDLDNFKLVNDSMGHAAGDELLRSVATRLQAAAAPGDLVARLGGDEFAVIRRNGSGREELADFARSIILELCRVHPIRGMDVAVGVSIGIASTMDGGEIDDLMHQADTALYEAKAKAGPAFVFADLRQPASAGERHAA